MFDPELKECVPKIIFTSVANILFNMCYKVVD